MDWDKAAEAYRDRILDYLEERYIPNLRRDLMTVRHFTPLDFKTELNAHLGSAFSIEPILTQSAWFRPHNRDERLENLYIVGAGTHPGAGIPGVVGSAEATASLMIGEPA
jgi:phytoene desaturase